MKVSFRGVAFFFDADCSYTGIKHRKKTLLGFLFELKCYAIFFLSSRKDNKRDTQESEISHLQDFPPMSPLSSMNFQGENNSITSSASESVSTNMSMDTVKFLKFAGWFFFSVP